MFNLFFITLFLILSSTNVTYGRSSTLAQGAKTNELGGNDGKATGEKDHYDSFIVKTSVNSSTPDTNGNCASKVDKSTRVITTIAGSGVASHREDNMPYKPLSLAANTEDKVLLANTLNSHKWAEPAGNPTAAPTANPTPLTTSSPSPIPAADPTVLPTAAPTSGPTVRPSPAPTAVPMQDPSCDRQHTLMNLFQSCLGYINIFNKSTSSFSLIK